MYSKRVIHKAYVDGNAYITVGDPYAVANGNPFRAPVKGEKLKNFDIPVRPAALAVVADAGLQTAD